MAEASTIMSIQIMQFGITMSLFLLTVSNILFVFQCLFTKIQNVLEDRCFDYWCIIYCISRILITNIYSPAFHFSIVHSLHNVGFGEICFSQFMIIGGGFFLCVSACLTIRSSRMNPFPQTSHENGFSPVCKHM